jgi:hypothetical protein
LAGLVCFTSLPAAAVVLSRRFAGDPRWRGWAPYSVATGVLMLGFFVACTESDVLSGSGAWPDAPTGLLQRIAIGLGWGWVMLLGLRRFRQSATSDTVSAVHPIEYSLAWPLWLTWRCCGTRV